MSIFLTSSGLETLSLQKRFMSLLRKKVEEVRVIFVPTAAVSPDAIAVIPKCMNDLLNLQIRSENIFVYDLHSKLSVETIKQYDVIYVCGGNTEYLLRRINEINFGECICEFIHEGIFLGVSAGSIIAASNLPRNLGLVPCPIFVHCKEGTGIGKLDIDKCSSIKLTNSRGLLISNENYEVVE